MTTNINLPFLYFLFIVIIIVIIEASNNVGSKLNLTKREVPKRYLIFPQGSNVQVQ